jgi:hypothetical protein
LKEFHKEREQDGNRERARDAAAPKARVEAALRVAQRNKQEDVACKIAQVFKRDPKVLKGDPLDQEPVGVADEHVAWNGSDPDDDE